MTATVDLVIEDPRWADLDLQALADKACNLALDKTGITGDWEICLLACDDARIADLNAEFREKPTATNVLSWPAQELAPAHPGAVPPAPEPGFDPALGDIAMAFETMQREAEDADLPLSDHIMHLLLHATLHLIGYDHETDEDAQLMESIEISSLATIGVANPYE